MSCARDCQCYGCRIDRLEAKVDQLFCSDGTCENPCPAPGDPALAEIAKAFTSIAANVQRWADNQFKVTSLVAEEGKPTTH